MFVWPSSFWRFTKHQQIWVSNLNVCVISSMAGGRSNLSWEKQFRKKNFCNHWESTWPCELRHVNPMFPLHWGKLFEGRQLHDRAWPLFTKARERAGISFSCCFQSLCDSGLEARAAHWKGVWNNFDRKQPGGPRSIIVYKLQPTTVNTSRTKTFHFSPKEIGTYECRRGMSSSICPFNCNYK